MDELPVGICRTLFEMEVNQLTIRKPEKHELKDVIDFIINDFEKRELLTVLAKSERDEKSVEEHQQIVDPRYLDWLLDDVSLIAVDEDTNTIAGICVNFIVKKEEQRQEDELENSLILEYLGPILQFMHKLEEGYNVFDELNTDKGLDLRFLGVKESYSNQGIGKRLSEESIELARKLELKFVQSVPTNPVTIRLFESLGFETKSELKCVNFFMNDGQPAFPRASSKDICRYVVKIL